MTERYERLFCYGDPPVDYHRRDTWTDEVKALYKRLEEKDYTALAALLKWDIEFLSDPKVMAELIKLKFAPEYPDDECRSELRKIANVIARRPGRRRRVLPYGDQLKRDFKKTIDCIEDQRLLEVKRDRKAIEQGVAIAMYEPMLEPRVEGEGGVLISGLSEAELKKVFRKAPKIVLGSRKGSTYKVSTAARREEIVRLASILYQVQEEHQFRIRAARSWALKAVTKHYADLRGVEALEEKQVETAIRRFEKAGRRRRLQPPA